MGYASYEITAAQIGWKLPFNLAILFHGLILASAIIVPQYFHKAPIIPEFLTVDLVNIANPVSTPAIKAPPPKPAASPKVTVHKPKVIKSVKIAPIAITPAKVKSPAPTPAPVKAISIKPIDRL